jgi:hypothetical protein
VSDVEYMRRCEHMRIASAQLRDAILLALRGIDPRTSDKPYALPKDTRS